MQHATLRLHPKMDQFIGASSVQETIDSLLKGAPVSSIPPQICHQVISGLTARRKDAILHNQDNLANKIDVILGEIQRGPEKFEIDTPYDPVKTPRTRALESPEQQTLRTTTRKLLDGKETVDDLDRSTRQSIGPVLKTSRILEISRANYSTGRSIDRQIETRHEYSVDSRRVAPKLILTAQLEKKLADAKAHYEEVKRQCYYKRRDYTILEKAEREKMEAKLDQEMLEQGSHLPTTLPLEYQKFSHKVLNAREKEQKGAKISMYDDAIANRKYAIALEKEEIQRNNEAFAKAFKANRDVLIKNQEQKRAGFQEVWRRKKDKVTAELAAEVEQARRAVENIERELEFARRSENKELGRIRSHSPQSARVSAQYNSFK